MTRSIRWVDSLTDSRDDGEMDSRAALMTAVYELTTSQLPRLPMVGENETVRNRKTRGMPKKNKKTDEMTIAHPKKLLRCDEIAFSRIYDLFVRPQLGERMMLRDRSSQKPDMTTRSLR